LTSGDVRDVGRGVTLAIPEGRVEIDATTGVVRRVTEPTYVMPDVPKLSAGYYAAPGMDLIDLFIGA
jgi:D-lactate dehydrogenase (cytochrome)